VLGSSVPSIVSLLFQRIRQADSHCQCNRLADCLFFLESILADLCLLHVDRLADVFLVGASTFIIALLTVSTQAIKAAPANPVEALRYE